MTEDQVSAALVDALRAFVAAHLPPPPPPSGDDWLTTDQTAELMKVRRGTLEIWRWKGKGPKFTKLGRNICRYRRRDVLNYIASHGSSGVPMRRVK